MEGVPKEETFDQELKEQRCPPSRGNSFGGDPEEEGMEESGHWKECGQAKLNEDARASRWEGAHLPRH